MKKLLSLISALCIISMVMADEETVRVQCPLGTTVTKLTLGVPVSYKVTIYADSGVKSVKWAGLPSGLKYNAKTGNIEGAASKAGSFTPKLTFVTKAKNKYTSSPNAITVSKFDNTIVGTYKGVFWDDSTDEVGYITMKIAASGKCSGKLAVLYPKKKNLSIVSGHFTDPQRNNSYFQLNFKDGRSLNLEYGQASFGNKYLGYFMQRSSEKNYEVDIAQDPFSRADTKALAKSLVKGKPTLTDGVSWNDWDYTLTISSSGKVSVKGTGTTKFSISNGFLIPTLYSTGSTYYFYVFVPWPAKNEYWIDYLQCTSSGKWSFWK